MRILRARRDFLRDGCDAAGNRTRVTYPDSTYITYDYDGLNRLTTVKSQGTTTLATYTYDARSRRDRLDYGNGTKIEYLYDVASRMVSVDNLVTSASYEYAYGYDPPGRMGHRDPPQAG